METEGRTQYRRWERAEKAFQTRRLRGKLGRQKEEQANTPGAVKRQPGEAFEELRCCLRWDQLPPYVEEAGGLISSSLADGGDAVIERIAKVSKLPRQQLINLLRLHVSILRREPGRKLGG